MAEASNYRRLILRARQVTRVYRIDSRQVPALRGVDLDVEAGQLVALRGRSGSGKTTLLNCIGGLDRPTSGEIWFGEKNVTGLSDAEWVRLRRRQIGFVFQSHALLGTYSAQENVDLMLRLAGMGRRERQARTEEVLTVMGLSRWMEHRTFELSGGQQQRVASWTRPRASRSWASFARSPTGRGRRY
jgi:putative ABC transport system ATP-binding protein